MKNENAYLYYQLRIKLLTHMLGTGSEASIYNKHNLEKAKKEIEKANKLVGRVTKALGKYVGAEITDDKQVAELKGVVNAYCALVGRTVELPNSVEDLLDLSKELDAEFKLMTEEGKTVSNPRHTHDPRKLERECSDHDQWWRWNYLQKQDPDR